jgi:hypothetical protein
MPAVMLYGAGVCTAGMKRRLRRISHPRSDHAIFFSRLMHDFAGRLEKNDYYSLARKEMIRLVVGLYGSRKDFHEVPVARFELEYTSSFEGPTDIM